SLLTDEAERFMTGAMPCTVDEFFAQLREFFPMSYYENRVKQALGRGEFFQGVSKQQYAAMAKRILRSLPATNSSAVCIAQAFLFAESDVMWHLRLKPDDATLENIGKWCDDIQELINIRFNHKLHKDMVRSKPAKTQPQQQPARSNTSSSTSNASSNARAPSASTSSTRPNA
ncbi:hypothetical protein GGF43_002953, partial [Coemansia sp. RSA 2618]